MLRLTAFLVLSACPRPTLPPPPTDVPACVLEPDAMQAVGVTLRKLEISFDGECSRGLCHFDGRAAPKGLDATILVEAHRLRRDRETTSWVLLGCDGPDCAHVATALGAVPCLFDPALLEMPPSPPTGHGSRPPGPARAPDPSSG